MGRDGELAIARQLTRVLADRGLFERLENTYCSLRRRLSPTAALDRALAELLPASEHEAIAAFMSRQGGSAQGDGGPPPIHHSLVDALEDRCEERQGSERQERRERMGVSDLAVDVATDAQLAAAYRERRPEAAAWLERFPSMVLVRASRNPTPTGRRLVVDHALKALLSVETDCRADGGDDAEAQADWCAALGDRLIAGNRAQGEASDDPSSRVRASDELDDLLRNAPERPPTTAPRPGTLDLLGSATSSLGDESSFIALIEAANGHDDHYDPTDPSTLEAMKSLLEDEALEGGENPHAPTGGRLRDELWTHMVWGYRVGRYLLTTHSRRQSSAPESPCFAAPDLVSYVGQARRRREVAVIMSAPDFGAALHYHALSSNLLEAWGADRTQVRRRVRLVEDLGFLTAMGAEDLTSDLVLEPEEARPLVGGRALEAPSIS